MRHRGDCGKHCLSVAVVFPHACSSRLSQMSRNGPLRTNNDDGDAALSSGQGLRIRCTISVPVHKMGRRPGTKVEQKPLGICERSCIEGTCRS